MDVSVSCDGVCKGCERVGHVGGVPQVGVSEFGACEVAQRVLKRPFDDDADVSVSATTFTVESRNLAAVPKQILITFLPS